MRKMIALLVSIAFSLSVAGIAAAQTPAAKPAEAPKAEQKTEKKAREEGDQGRLPEDGQGRRGQVGVREEVRQGYDEGDEEEGRDDQEAVVLRQAGRHPSAGGGALPALDAARPFHGCLQRGCRSSRTTVTQTFRS